MDAYAFNIGHDINGNGSVTFELVGSVNGQVLDTRTISTYRRCAADTGQSNSQASNGMCIEQVPPHKYIVCPTLAPVRNPSDTGTRLSIPNSSWYQLVGENGIGITPYCRSGRAQILNGGYADGNGFGLYLCVD